MKNFFMNLKPVTKITIVVCATAIIIALIMTGQLDTVLDFFK